MQFTSEITVRKVAQCGTDQLIVDAARVSTGASSRNKDRDAGLLDFLMSRRHGSPFEHGMLTVYVHAPIFVLREWFRHRIGWSYSEESARWKPLEPTFWVPRKDRPYVVAEGNKNTTPKHDKACDMLHGVTERHLFQAYSGAYERYTNMLRLNVAREVARSVLPVAIYSSCYVTCNPRSLMAFLSLRTHEPTAKFPSYPQLEIEEAARQLETFFAEHWPLTYAAYQANGRVSP